MITDLILLFDEFMIFPEQAEYATFANEMLKSQTRKPDYKVAEVILTRIFNIIDLFSEKTIWFIQ